MNAIANGGACGLAHGLVSGTAFRSVHAKRREETRPHQTTPDMTTPEEKLRAASPLLVVVEDFKSNRSVSDAPARESATRRTSQPLLGIGRKR